MVYYLQVPGKSEFISGQGWGEIIDVLREFLVGKDIVDATTANLGNVCSYDSCEHNMATSFLAH